MIKGIQGNTGVVALIADSKGLETSKIKIETK